MPIGVPQGPVDLRDPDRRPSRGGYLPPAQREPGQQIDLAGKVESELPVFRRPAPVHVQLDRIPVVLEWKAIAQGSEVFRQLEIDDGAAQQPRLREFPVPQPPGGLEELEVLALRNEPPT